MGLFSRFLLLGVGKLTGNRHAAPGWSLQLGSTDKGETGMQSSSSGWGNGLLGVIIFSGSLPATRVAVGGFSALFLTSARAVIAALIGVAVLFLLRQARPARGDLVSLAIVAVGVVVGFPLLTALALQHITSAHSIVFIGLLPLSTAIFGVLRGGERPQPMFWLFSILGSATVAGFALSNDGTASLTGDLLMVAAIVLCGLGYAEGAALSRRLGGWQVISWALLLSLPLMVPIMILTWPSSWSGVGVPAWIGLAYVSIFSMFVGFIFWYRGLALGGIARVGQLQQLQPFFGLALAGLLLHEPVAWSMIAATALVVACVFFARRFA
jgi:drug/metabolite transporter (DMT)-like permease